MKCDTVLPRDAKLLCTSQTAWRQQWYVLQVQYFVETQLKAS